MTERKRLKAVGCIVTIEAILKVDKVVVKEAESLIRVSVSCK